jgi:hypothetical protein
MLGWRLHRDALLGPGLGPLPLLFYLQQPFVPKEVTLLSCLSPSHQAPAVHGNQRRRTPVSARSLKGEYREGNSGLLGGQRGRLGGSGAFPGQQQHQGRYRVSLVEDKEGKGGLGDILRWGMAGN